MTLFIGALMGMAAMFIATKTTYLKISIGWNDEEDLRNKR